MILNDLQRAEYVVVDGEQVAVRHGITVNLPAVLGKDARQLVVMHLVTGACVMQFRCGTQQTGSMHLAADTIAALVPAWGALQAEGKATGDPDVAASPATLPANHIRNFYPASPAPSVSEPAIAPVSARERQLREALEMCNDFRKDNPFVRMADWQQQKVDEALAASPAPVEGEECHTDDVAVDRFAAAMKSKLAKKRGDGRRGWDDEEFCPVEWLKQEMRRHCIKGDPIDVGNFAMMIWNREERR